MTDIGPPRRVAILGFGAMGAGLGQVWQSVGFEVATVTAGRSPRTEARARAAGVTDLEDVGALVADCDTFLSVVPADQAVPLAEQVMQAAQGRATPLHFVDCNAMRPSKTKRVAEIVASHGGVFTDAGIIGPPPSPGRNATLFLASGPNREVLAPLATPEVTFKALGDGLTEATEMKLLFAAINKGTVALLMNVLAAAERAGLKDQLMAQVEDMRPGLMGIATRSAPSLADKSARWAIEMEDLADGLEDLDADGAYHRAAAESYRRLARNLDAAGAGPGSDPPPGLEALLAAWLTKPGAA
jgi:3-hydroxyisobutyrate dehydrogenase-like beta-hydroxyacid dehydrogenase